MTQIQFVNITTDGFLDLIDARLNKHFKEVEKYLQPKTPTTYLTRHEVAELLSVDLSTVHNWKKQGKLIAYQIGGRVFYKRAEVENSIVRLK
jgi:excisionase family DNA binding protein